MARNAHLRAFVLTLGRDFDGYAVAVFDLDQIVTLFVEQVDRSFGARTQLYDRALALGGFVLDQAQGRKTRRGCGANQACAIAVRTFTGGRFEHSGAQALAAHFHQAEARNPSDLNTRAVVLERVLHRLFDFTDVGIVFHVDEVDHHEASHVAQAQLACDLARSFEVGVERGRLDPVFLGGTARVDVDRHQRLGRVNDQIAARFELHHRIVHGAQLVFRAVSLEQRHRIGIGFHPARVARHQQLHEALGQLVAVLTFDHDFLDIAVVDVADRAFDQVAVRMDEAGRGGGECVLTDLVPQARQVIEIALDLGLGAAEARGADDQPHRLGKLEIGDDLFQPLAVAGRADLAADPAAVRAVGHQHGVTTREAEIGGERGTLVAALFLHDLHQHHLAALDNVLNLVAAAQRHALGAHFVDFLGAAATCGALATTGSRTLALTAARATTAATARIVIAR